MTMKPEDIDAIFRLESASSQLSAGLNDADDDGLASVQEETWRTLKLREVLTAAQQASSDGSGDLVQIAEKIGDGSRDRRSPSLRSSASDKLTSTLQLCGGCHWENPAFLTSSWRLCAKMG